MVDIQCSCWQPYHKTPFPHHPALIRDITNWHGLTPFPAAPRHTLRILSHNVTSYNHCQLADGVLTFLIKSLCHQIILFAFCEDQYADHATSFFHSFSFRSEYDLEVPLLPPCSSLSSSCFIVIFALPVIIFLLSHFLFSHCMLFWDYM